MPIRVGSLYRGMDAELLGSPTHSSKRARFGFGDVILALIGPVVVVTSAFFYAAVAFRGAYANGFSLGFLQAFFTLITTNAIFILRGQMAQSFVVPDATAAFFFVQMAGNIEKNLRDKLHVAEVPEDVLIGHMLFAMAAFGSLSGAALALASAADLTHLIQFIPYQVTGGFIAGMGILTLRSAVGIASGIETFSALASVLLQSWAGGAPTAALAQLVLCVALAGITFALQRRYGKSLPVVPMVALFSIFAFYAAKGVTGMSVQDCFDKGWFTAGLSGSGLSPWDGLKATFGVVLHPKFCPTAIFSSENFLIWVSMTVILILNWSFTMIGAMKALKVSAKVDQGKEVGTVGVMNLCGGLLGGVPSNYNFEFMILAEQFHAYTRVGPGFLLIILVVLFVSTPGIIALVPRFIIGGLLLYVAFELLDDWLLKSHARIAENEWRTLAAMAGCMVLSDLNFGVLLGLVLSLASCAWEYNAITGIVSEDCLGTTCSHVERSPEQRGDILARGNAVRIFWVEGYLFFGSASAVIADLKKRLHAARAEVSHVVIDLSRVPAVDASGVSALVDFAMGLEPQLILTGMVRRLSNAIRNAQASALESSSRCESNVQIFHDLDAALEYVEEQLLAGCKSPHIARDSIELTSPGAPRVQTTLASLVKDTALAELLVSAGTIETNMPVGKSIWQEGDHVETVAFLIQGALTATLQLPQAMKPKPLDMRHLNLAKGDTFVEVRQTFRQRKYTKPSALGVLELAARMKQHLGRIEVSRQGTCVLLVPVTFLVDVLEGRAGGPPLQAALQQWMNNHLVDWAVWENGKVREIIARSRLSKGERHWSEV